MTLETRKDQFPIREGVVTATEGAVLHAHDMIPPILRLAQDQSVTGKSGFFIRSDTEEEFESLEVTPIQIQATRTFWGAGEFLRDRQPLCTSLNAVMADDTLVDGTPTKFAGTACEECEVRATNPFEQTAKEGWCMPGYSVMLMDVNSFEIYGLRLNGTSNKLGRIFGNKSIIRKAVLNLHSEKVVTNTSNFFQMKAKTLRQLDESEIEVAEGFYQEYGSPVIVLEAPSVPDQSRDEASQKDDSETESVKVMSEAAFDKACQELNVPPIDIAQVFNGRAKDWMTNNRKGYQEAWNFLVASLKGQPATPTAVEGPRNGADDDVEKLEAELRNQDRPW